MVDQLKEEFMFLNKRGQFFILASVLLSVLLLSMAFTVNEVVANEPDYSFTNYADNIERESSRVIDYEVFSNIPIEELNNFISIIETDFRDREVGGNFMIIYGNSSRIEIRNIGTEGITIGSSGGLVLNGASSTVSSKIRLGGVSVDVSHFKDRGTKVVLEETDLAGSSSVNIGFNEQEYVFPITEVNQVIFIVQKDVNDETFVEVR